METSRHITVSELSVVVRTSSGNAQEVRPARVLGPGVNSVLRRTIIRSQAGRTTGLQTGLNLRRRWPCWEPQAAWGGCSRGQRRRGGSPRSCGRRGWPSAFRLLFLGVERYWKVFSRFTPRLHSGEVPGCSVEGLRLEAGRLAGGRVPVCSPARAHPGGERRERRGNYKGDSW